MYPLVRIRKVQPDGIVRWSWFAYRIPDHGASLRLFVPAFTPRRHQDGTWAPDGTSVVAIDPRRPFVVHRWEREGLKGFYVDTARSIEVGDDVVTYVDLFLDLSYTDGAWHVLDEAELAMASPDDALAARASRAEVEQLIADRDPRVELDAEIWRLPSEVASLRPNEAPPHE